jgi:hypothetical protein
MSSFHFRTIHLAYIVIAFIAGITFACSAVLGSVMALGAASSTYNQQGRLIIVGLICCFFFCGSTRYYQYQSAYFTHRNLLEKNCTIIATVQEILPRLDEQEQICIALHVHQVELENKEHTLDKKMYLFLPFYTKLWIKPYQKIKIKNIILKHPKSNSYQEYLIRENIWAVAHPKWLSYTTIKKPSLLMQQIDQLCSMPLQATDHAVSQLTHSLYLSIFCGKKIKSTTTTKMKELFSYWGISHHLARSGLHLIILIGLLLFLFSFIPCAASKKQWLIVALLCFYYVTTYSSVAFMRAFYMYLLYTLCKQLHVPSSAIHILLITTLLTLVINPCHLFFLDFQLSFSITLLILWFCQVTQSRKTVAL